MTYWLGKEPKGHSPSNLADPLRFPQAPWTVDQDGLVLIV